MTDLQAFRAELDKHLPRGAPPRDPDRNVYKLTHSIWLPPGLVWKPPTLPPPSAS